MENVPTFRYLGRLLYQTDYDWPVVQQNIMQARYNTTAGGGRSEGVGKFLQGSGAGDSIVWVGNVRPFGVNDKEDRGDTHVVPANDRRKKNEEIRRWDMGDYRGRRNTRGSGNPVG